MSKIGIATKPSLNQALEPLVVPVPLTVVDSLISELLNCPEDVREAAAEYRASVGGPSNYKGFLIWALGELKTIRGETGPSRSPNNRFVTPLLLKLSNADEQTGPDVVFTASIEGIEVELSNLFEALPGLTEVPKDLRWLYKPLCFVRAWMLSCRKSLYEAVAAYQSDFLITWSPRRLKPLNVSDVSRALNLPYHATTYSRMTLGRRARLITGQRSALIDVRVLFPTVEDLVKYRAISKINLELQHEWQQRKALSDSKIASVVGIARRTVAKYREEAALPPAHVRQKAYRDGSMAAAPEIKLELVEQLGMLLDMSEANKS
jgi:hypothetical protein